VAKIISGRYSGHRCTRMEHGSNPSEEQAICVHLFNLWIVQTLSNNARRMFHDQPPVPSVFDPCPSVAEIPRSERSLARA
jgi:hypothetical protein